MFRSAFRAFTVSAILAGLSACGGQTENVPANSDAASAASNESKTGASSKLDLAEKAGENTYVAKSYGMTVTAPDGWYVMDSDITKKLMDVGKELTTTDMQGLQKSAMELSLNRTTNIFGFMKFAPGAPRSDGAGVMAMAEDISAAPGVERGSDYFFHLKNVFKQTGLNVQIADGYSEVKIDGHTFDRMNLTMTAPTGDLVHQQYIATRHGNEMVCLILSYASEADLPTLDGILNSIKLDWK